MAMDLPKHTNTDVANLVEAAMAVLYSDSNPSQERGSLQGLAETLPKLRDALQPFLNPAKPD